MEELPSVLWAYRTMPQESMGVTPFQLVCGGEAVVLVENRMRSMRVKNYNQKENNQKRQVELDLLLEAQEEAVTRLSMYKSCMSQAYNKRVIPLSFQVGDFVWKKIQSTRDVRKLEL